MRLILPAVVFLLAASTAAAGEFVLADRDSKIAPPPIVLFKDAPPITREAAQSLAKYIEKTTGSQPTLIEGEPRPLPERAIWVGVQPAVKTVFPKLDLEFKHPEEILIAAHEHHVLIAGRDRWDPARLAMKFGETGFTGKQEEYGTCNALYTFLQDYLGVRWFWPGELGVDVLQRDRVTIPPVEYRHHPQIRGRSTVFHYSNLADRGYGKSQDWTRVQRLQLDSLEMPGGHGFGTWWDRYQKLYPDIFALQPDGTRSGFPNPRTVKLCMSNPKVWELWLEDVKEQIAKDPTQTLFNASPNDGWASGHCVCPKCTAWDHPKGEPRVFNWYKKNETRPATSDRDVTFANTLGKLLKEKYPGKDYRVMMLSYGHSRPVPVAARPADNVVMAIVANFLGRKGLVDRGSTRGDTYRQQFDGWAKIVPSMLWRPNTGSPAGWQQGLPDLSTQQTIRDLKDVAAARCEGIYIDSVWEHWATHGPQYYMMAQLVWDPNADDRAILADYYQRAFGPAAAPVREYFEAFEQARTAFVAKNEDAGVFAFTKLYTPELLRDSQTHLDRAMAAVPAGSTFAKRVAFVQVGLTYTKMVVENIRLMAGYWAKKDDAVAAQVKANWDTIAKLIGVNAPAINAGPVRPTTPRMAGLHPDNPPAKGKKGPKVNDLDK